MDTTFIWVQLPASFYKELQRLATEEHTALIDLRHEACYIKIPLEILTDAIFSLDLEQKRQLLERLEQKTFEEEEATYEDDSETIAEIETVRVEYKTGEYLTLDEYLANNLKSSS